MAQIRTGEATVPTQESAGTDGSITSPRVLTFDIPARPVIIWNRTGGSRAIYVKINVSTAKDFGGGSDDGKGYFPINDGASVEVSLGNNVAIQRISFVTTNASDDLDDVEVHGWVSR